MIKLNSFFSFFIVKMQLPDDVLAIIRDYSKPLTRPDWRTLKPLSGHLFYHGLNYRLNNLKIRMYTQMGLIQENDRKLICFLERVFQYMLSTQWGQIYKIVRNFGICYASIHLKIPLHDLYKMPDMIHAQNHYINHYVY